MGLPTAAQVWNRLKEDRFTDWTLAEVKSFVDDRQFHNPGEVMTFDEFFLQAHWSYDIGLLDRAFALYHWLCLTVPEVQSPSYRGGTFVRIPMPCRPFRDERVDDNGAAIDTIKSATDGDIEAKVWFGKADCDGVVDFVAGEFAGKSVPLEVGTSHPSTLFLHLFQSEGLARWPYGSDWMVVFVCDGPRNFDHVYKS